MTRASTAVFLTAAVYWAAMLPLWFFNDRYFLVGIIMGNAENDVEISSLNYCFDALHNITHERVINRCHHETDGVRPLRLQTPCDSIRRVTHLPRQLLDTLTYISTNQ